MLPITVMYPPALILFTIQKPGNSMQDHRYVRRPLVSNNSVYFGTAAGVFFAIDKKNIAGKMEIQYGPGDSFIGRLRGWQDIFFR